ncbi:PP2C family protein-serine/threonine phosphatase [Dactylosporangium sp. NPDC051541]|uniref:PP2C family protein-serine/threonine phosphatase n=1 Tax=Dactylosporangium sp. NPDC051541 TaxID=3363977 RepID=UPI00379B39AC
MELSGTSMMAAMLGAVEDAAPVDAVEAITRELAKALDARSASFLIADFGGRALVRLAHAASGDAGGHDVRRRHDEVATVLPLDGGPMEQTLRTQEPQVFAGGDAWTVWAPVTERGEAIGLLELVLPVEPAVGALVELGRVAHLLGFVVIANRRHTDLFEWGQRTTPFNLSAEIQRRLLPGAFTCEAGAFTLAGWLEPAASIAGDTFDYSLARDLLHFSLTDAMGHGVASALTATLGVGSLRNTRRQGRTLVEQAQAANAAVAEHAGAGSSFLTAVLGRVDLASGVCTLINAGHLPPLLVRDGDVEPVRLPKNFPLGMLPDSTFVGADVPLRAGDRLVIVTDGMTERRAAQLDLHAEVRRVAGLHPREATRALADAVLAVAGPVLADDATLLIIDWYDEHILGRRSRSGADSDRASGRLPG